ncbi:MAG TPA: DUF2510 domain-containing protein, partial [Acidimicrobiia bacterium]|nr:DUF2510 domain-containing protein [Acidimicrobiia bacterium]
MSELEPGVAGWHRDPSERFELRYWDGSEWTGWVATGGRMRLVAPFRPEGERLAPRRRPAVQWKQVARGAAGRVRRAAAAVAGDLAVHGLAYLGVLLLFTGLFGFMVFAFGSVDESLRPVAEAAIPLAAFGAAAFLRRSGSPHAASALSFLGGALLPIVIVASFVDGSDVPPDLHGWALLGVVSAASLAVAAGYWWYCGRRPASPLRFLVAPAAWLAVALAAHATKAEIPAGRDLAAPGAAQMAVVAVALVASVFGIRALRSARAAVLEAPTLLSGAVGFGVVYVLAVLAAAEED